MKKIQWYAACVFVLSMLIIPCSAMAFFGVDIGVGYWQQDPSGGMSYKAIDPATDTLDLKNDLFLDKQNKPFVRAKVELPLVLPNIYFMATPMKFEGSGTLSRTDFKWGDTTFSGHAPISSRLKLDHYDFTLYYPIPLLKAATLNTLSIELGLDARKIDFEGTITGTNANSGITETVSKSNTLYVPMIYAGIIVKPIDLLSIEFEARGMSAGSNHYYDYIGRLRVNPIPLVFIAGGYRSESLKIDESDVLADIKFSGPFLEAGVHF